MKKVFKLLSGFSIILIIALMFVIKPIALSYDENGFENDYSSVITSGMAYYMSTEYGEDASTEARFHYMSTQTNTYIMFTLKSDETWESAKKVEVRCNRVNYFDPETGNDGKIVATEGFPEEFYECEAEASNLTPGTQYMWYATDGKTKSRLMSFETAPSDNSNFTFVFTADTQVYAETGAYSYSKQATEHLYDMIEKKLAADDKLHMNFFVNGGDTVENAGKANNWDYFWNHEFAQKYAMMSFIGNHDFTGLISSGSVDGRFWASQYNFPRNGCPEAYSETTYWFKYGDTLFVFLSCSRGSINAQAQWLDQVLSQNKSQYIVCGIHYPSNETGDHSRELVPIFDKYGVDLVLQGHGHSYVLWKNYYNYKANPNGEGTTYMEMGSCNFTDRAIFAFITVTDTNIRVENYNYDGALVSDYTLGAKRPKSSEISEFNEEEFVKSFAIDVEQTNRKTAVASWDDSAYGNLQSITLRDNGSLVATKICYGTKYAYMNISGLTPDTDYNYTLELNYINGEKKEYPISFTTKITSYAKLENIAIDDGEDYYRITFTPTYHQTVTSIKSYLNGEFYKDLSMKAGRLAIDQEDFIDGVNIIELRGVLNDNTEVVLYTWEKGEALPTLYHVTYDLDGGEATGLVTEFEEGNAPTLPTPTKAGFNFLGWYEGETKVTALTDKDYNLKAKWEEIVVAKYTITYDLDGGNATGLILEFEEGNAPTLPTPTKDGFTFLGWYEGETKVTTLTDKNYNLKAKWEEVVTPKTKYTISYDLDGGSATGLVNEFEEGNAPALPTPTKDGYNFLGWYEGETKVTTLTNKNYNLKAKWEQIPAPVEPAKSSGCKAEAIRVIFGAISMMAFALIIRKKH